MYPLGMAAPSREITDVEPVYKRFQIQWRQLAVCKSLLPLIDGERIFHLFLLYNKLKSSYNQEF